MKNKKNIKIMTEPSDKTGYIEVKPSKKRWLGYVECAKGRYKTNSRFRKWMNALIWHPLLNHIPKSLANLVIASEKSRDAKTLKENAGNFKSVELMYTHDWKNYETAGEKIFNFVWGSFSNVKAVKNRLTLVEDAIYRALHRRYYETPKPINILSVACGSARSVRGAVVISAEENRNIIFRLGEIILVDDSAEALKCAENLMLEIGINKKVRYVQSDAFKLTLPNKHFDVIEMVGLLEYITPDEKAVAVMSKLYFALKPGGYFITSNACPNPEQRFITDIIKWPLIYRTPEELAALIAKSRFKNITVKIEPLGIQAVAICRK